MVTIGVYVGFGKKCINSAGHWLKEIDILGLRVKNPASVCCTP